MSLSVKFDNAHNYSNADLCGDGSRVSIDAHYTVGIRLSDILKHTTTLFSLSDHYILSREWRVIVHQVQTNYHGRPMVL